MLDDMVCDKLLVRATPFFEIGNWKEIEKGALRRWSVVVLQELSLERPLRLRAENFWWHDNRKLVYRDA